MNAEALKGSGRVFRKGGSVLFVALLRQTHPKGDPACTDPVADVLTR
jgi:hypothetical protein